MSAAGARRRARGYALQVLYSLDVEDAPSTGEAIAAFWASFEHDEPDETARRFAGELVEATMQARDEVDDAIQKASKNWRLERMSRVDRNILRMATRELLSEPDVPVRVAINEAVELAKRFGAEESPAFVNGVLDRIAQPLDRK